ncbi:hypothetical protein CSB20_09345 [bacterium DOLZORAL124_64_63]|nr:MAG: hypothetical protein CSB20_09345 [bacterium DOLZORAL124_64_63]
MLMLFALVFGFLLPEPAAAQTSAVEAAGILNAQESAACRAGMRLHETERGRQLLGELVRGDFPRLLPGWDEECATYEPRPEDVATLRAITEDTDIFCILGTWCGDSRREVPRFWKILQEAANPHLQLVMFGVGRGHDRQARALLAEIGFDVPLREQYDVQLVPTFIFKRGDEELGRIVETPETTLEEDAARILNPASLDAKDLDDTRPSWR